MFNSSCISFTKLLSRYTPGSYLVETDYGSEFRNQNHFLLKLSHGFFWNFHVRLEDSAPPLIARAKQALKNNDLLTDELISMVKVLYIATRILSTASSSRKDRLITESQQADEIADQALNKLAQVLHRSKLSICLELAETQPEMCEKAYQLAKENSLSELSPNQLNVLATITWEKQDWPFLYHLIDLGGVPSIPSQDVQHILLIDYLDKGNDTCLATLIRGGFDCTFDYGEPFIPFPFTCLKQGMSESIKAMIEKKVPLSFMKDKEGNTLLHYAFLLGNVALIKALLKIMNPTLKNEQAQTPLACLLDPKGNISQYLQIPDDKMEAFLQDIFSLKHCNRLEEFRTALQKVPKKDCLLKFNDIELAFLLGSDELTSILFRHITRNRFETGCAELGKTYLKAAAECFFLSAFSFSEKHFKTGCEMVPLSKKIDKAHPEDLLEMAKELGTFSRSERNELRIFLDNVRNRTRISATPEEPELREELYKTIETNIKAIVFALRQKKDPQLTSYTLKEFIDGAEYCGGRYFAVAWQQALHVCCGAKINPRSNLERSLAQFRYLCLEDAVRILNDNNNNVHIYNRAVHDLGESLGIPRCPETKAFKDSFCLEGYNIDEILKLFNRTYTPNTVIFEWILPLLKSKTDETFSSDYIELQKSVVPKDWKVPEAEVKGKPTEEEKWYTFLARFVHNETGELQVSAIRYLLEKLDIITCNLK
jgi:hypothetical protein